MIRILTAVVLLTTIASPAYAYIDVAIGGLILQAIVGGFFAFMVIWRDWTTKIKNFLKGNGFTNATETSETPVKSEE